MQGERITQGISCADVADVCLKALHDPAARNKTFEVVSLPFLAFLTCTCRGHSRQPFATGKHSLLPLGHNTTKFHAFWYRAAPLSAP